MLQASACCAGGPVTVPGVTGLCCHHREPTQCSCSEQRHTGYAGATSDCTSTQHSASAAEWIGTTTWALPASSWWCLSGWTCCRQVKGQCIQLSCQDCIRSLAVKVLCSLLDWLWMSEQAPVSPCHSSRTSWWWLRNHCAWTLWWRDNRYSVSMRAACWSGNTTAANSQCTLWIQLA